MEKLLKFTELFHHFPLISAQFREFEGTQDILKTNKKEKSGVNMCYQFFKIDFSKKIEKKIQKKIFFSETKSFYKTILIGLNHLTITHFSTKFEPNRGTTVRTLVIDAQCHPVASFLQLIRRLLTGPVALRILAVETKSFSVLGALLQKLPGHLIDGTCLFEVQNLVETFDEKTEPDLAAAIRHFLLLDFRLWVHSTYTTRVSHIQVACINV